MRRIKSGTVKTMAAVWLAYLIYLIVMQRISPDDPWSDMFVHPLFLILAPILVACIPLLVPSGHASMEESTGEEGGGLQKGTRKIFSDTVRRMLLVWSVSLMIFASPHRFSRMALLDPVLHHPVFLLVAPLLFACFTPIIWSGFHAKARDSEAAAYRRRRIDAIKSMVASIIFILLVIPVFLWVNSPALQVGRIDRLKADCAALLLLAIGITALWRSMSRIREK